METLIDQIINWAEETNIIYGSNVEKETLRLVSKFGELTNFIDEADVCRDGIGQSIIEMIIICRMKHISLDECLLSTSEITDHRITDPKLALIFIMRHVGELAENLTNNKDIKTEMGYLLIYLAALTKSLNLSMRRCLEKAYRNIKKYKGIIFDGMFIDEADEKYQYASAYIRKRNRNRKTLR